VAIGLPSTLLQKTYTLISLHLGRCLREQQKHNENFIGRKNVKSRKLPQTQSQVIINFEDTDKTIPLKTAVYTFKAVGHICFWKFLLKSIDVAVIMVIQ